MLRAMVLPQPWHGHPPHGIATSLFPRGSMPESARLDLPRLCARAHSWGRSSWRDVGGVGTIGYVCPQTQI